MPNKLTPEVCEFCKMAMARLDVPTGRACMRTGTAVKDDDSCSYFTEDVFTCNCCGNEYPGRVHAILLEQNDDGSYSYASGICHQCLNHKYECVTCAFGNTCEFDTNSSPLPKLVQQTIQQGNMTTVTQVMNPERIRITCENGCPCWSPDFGCSKQNHGTCLQYRMNHA